MATSPYTPRRTVPREKRRVYAAPKGAGLRESCGNAWPARPRPVADRIVAFELRRTWPAADRANSVRYQADGGRPPCRSLRARRAL